MKIKFPETGSEIGGEEGINVRRGDRSGHFQFDITLFTAKLVKSHIKFYKFLKQEFKKEYEASLEGSRRHQYAYIKLGNCGEIVYQLQTLLHYMRRKPRKLKERN